MLEITQIKTPAYALLSYIIRDPLSTECIVIDPGSGINSHISTDSMNIKEVINTHLHPDHTMGNHFFAGKIPIRAHPGDSGFAMRAVHFALSTIFNTKIPPKVSFDLNDGDQIHIGNTSIKVLHTPGHSPGSICLYWPGNLICGDTIFVGNIGRTDIPGGSFSLLSESIRKILTLPSETRIWPGHYYMEKYTSTLTEESSFLKSIINNR
ncbi:MAG: MBL fold metallo-hydrolase [Deltaproteobacteria bacterium]|nr:MBL fold metallo-hydrolase [Deltaproteobacteria bacterium]